MLKIFFEKMLQKNLTFSYPLIPSQHLGIRTQGVSVRGGYFLLQGREGQVKR